MAYLALGLQLSPARAQYSGAVPSVLQQDAAFQALNGGNVYIDPRLTKVDQQALQSAALQGQDSPHTVVKIALLARLPAYFKDRSFYAGALHKFLGLDNNALIVIVLAPGIQHGGISIAAPNLTAVDKTNLANQYKSQILADPTSGTSALAYAVAGKVNGQEYSGSIIIWIVFFAIVVVIILFIAAALRRKKARLILERAPVDALRNNVLGGIEYLDNYTDILPKDNPNSAQVIAMRQDASMHYDQAIKILDRATETSDLARGQILLNQAQSEIVRGRRYLDIVTGGTGNIPGDEAMRPQPLPESAAQALSIPEAERGVSFFSGRPAPISGLIPVTINAGGQTRTVMATPEEAAAVQNGQMPPVRSFTVNGSQMPWYACNGYDPYRDYWSTQNSGGGFGTGMVAGWIGAELIDSLFAPRWYGGWNSPYNFSPDFGYNQGNYDSMVNNSGQFGGFDTGFGNVSGGMDQGMAIPDLSDGSASGTDFSNADYSNMGADPGNFDQGSIDPGSGFDSGGSDFGGFDSGGGSDF